MKVKVALAVLVLCYVLTPEWCLPGEGLHRAIQILTRSGEFSQMPPSVWGRLVGLIGWNALRLELVSLVSAVICSVIVAGTVEDLYHYVIGKVRLRRAPGTYRFEGVTACVTALTVAAFLLTPGHLVAATRIHPLMTALVFPLLSIWIIVHRVTTAHGAAAAGLSRKFWLVLLALLLLAIGGWEFVSMGRRLYDGALTALATFLLIGVAPLLLLVHLIRRHRSIDSSGLTVYFVGWTLALLYFGALAYFRTLDGLDVARIAKQVVRGSEGCEAIVSDGQFDDLFLFLKPPDQRLISYARDADESRRPELVEWTKERGLTNLVWAAEIGPRTLVDAWRQADPTNCARRVRSPDTYFPTVEDWRAAYLLFDRRKSTSDPNGWLVKLLSSTGNGLACQFLEQGKDREAWNILWVVIEKVDRCNCTAIANLYAMIKRGFRPAPEEQAWLDKLNREVVTQYRTPRALLKEAFAGGRVYIKSAGRGALQNKSTVFDVTGGFERESEFLLAVSTAPNERMSAESARAKIRRGIAANLVRLQRLGPQLLRLDLELGDLDAAERDAKDILELSERDPVANRTLGRVQLSRGDYALAEKFLNVALDADPNDDIARIEMVRVLLSVGRFEEAARIVLPVAAADPNSWVACELLARAQIRQGNLIEGERTLEKAVFLVNRTGSQRGAAVRIGLDRAWLGAMRREKAAVSAMLSDLEKRTDLTPSDLREIAELKAMK